MSSAIRVPLLLFACACLVALRWLVMFGDWILSDGRA